jgi:hypothetical protein
LADESDMQVGPVIVAAAVAIALASPGRAVATCSPSALDGVRAELKAATAPDCGPRTLRRAFDRACDRAAALTERVLVQCADGGTPRIGRAHAMLGRVMRRLGRPGLARRLAPACADLYAARLMMLDAALEAAATGTETTTTTTTAPPGTPTTSTLAPCVTVALEVDKGDCTGVTSDPPRLVQCGATCSDQVFTVPASGSLRLNGTPAPGDTGVTWDGDCENDGTVDLSNASGPDCSLSCTCSSGS